MELKVKTQEKKPLFTMPLQTVDDDRDESIEDLIARYQVPFGSLASMKTQMLREFLPLILDAFFKEEKGKGKLHQALLEWQKRAKHEQIDDV